MSGESSPEIDPKDQKNNLIPSRSEDKSRQTQTPVRLLAQTAVDAILEKKGREIVVLDVHAVSGIADLFIVATGDSELQIKAIADSVRSEVRDAHNERPWHTEGTEHNQWVLMDYVDLVVHIFNPEKREYYSLERLWGDAPSENVPENGSGDSVELLNTDGGPIV